MRLMKKMGRFELSRYKFVNVATNRVPAVMVEKQILLDF